jgi:hypothetical protein
MEYKNIPSVVNGNNKEAVIKFLNDISLRKEFSSLSDFTPEVSPLKSTYIFTPLLKQPTNIAQLTGLQLHGAQIFVSNFHNPNTPFSRLLIYWRTGAGKTLAMLSIIMNYIEILKKLPMPPEQRPSIFCIGLTRSIVQRELLRHPEFGFVTNREILEMERLKVIAANTGIPSDIKAYTNYIMAMRRRLSNKQRGGNFKFFGYQEFANRLFIKSKTSDFDIVKLYARTQSHQEDFFEKIQEEIKAGNIAINQELLDEIKGGFITADEIHDTYNISAENNYGIAIQYVLDVLGKDAPRAVYLSATPMSGSGAEAVDLLNFLVPAHERPDGKKFRRQDFFEFDNNGKPVPLPGALERIGLLSAGRVSFLFDTDINAYPKRVFEGASMPNIPYLKFNVTEISELHKNTLLDYIKKNDLKVDLNNIRISLPPKTHTLYDMVFPNPDNDKIGLYSSADIPSKYLAASEEWKAKNGVIVQRYGEMNIITGPFLKLGNLEKYALKYSKLVKYIIEQIKNGPGKFMIYHHRVKLSGVLLLQEIFRMNGFTDEISAPTPDVICSICAVPQKFHKKTAIGTHGHHDYIPARFVMAHYYILRKTMDENVDKFISPANLDGYLYRILIGSRIMRQSYDLKATEGLDVLSLPTDIPTLLQLFGRIIRKESAALLPPDRRTSKIRIWANDLELPRYEEKMKDYVLIQLIEREFRKYAIDGFANYPKLARAYPELKDPNSSTLDALPYMPVVLESKRDHPEKYVNDPPEIITTFKAFHANKYIHYIEQIVKAILRIRPVYTYDDLVKDVKTRGAVKNEAIDPSKYTNSEIALAIKNVISDNTNNIKYFPPYIVSFKSKKIDVESYIRPEITVKMKFNVNSYIKEKLETKNFSIKVTAFEAEEFKNPVDIILNYDADFHTRFMKKIIEQIWKTGYPSKDSNMYQAIQSYLKYEIMLIVGDIDNAIFKNLKIIPPQSNRTRPIAYVYMNVIYILDPSDYVWKEGSMDKLPIKENDHIVGYMEKRVGRMKLKLRQSLETLKNIEVSDARLLSRGAICETKFRSDQVATAKKLGLKMEGSSRELCDNIKYKLISNEEHQLTKQPNSRIKWFYFFNEVLPKYKIE